MILKFQFFNFVLGRFHCFKSNRNFDLFRLDFIKYLKLQVPNQFKYYFIMFFKFNLIIYFFKLYFIKYFDFLRIKNFNSTNFQ